MKLINPAKSKWKNQQEDKCEEVKFLQWRNTNSVIEWLKEIKNKKKYKFLRFDIAQFYPSISKKLLTDSINFAKNYIDISKEGKEILFHAKEALLFEGDST